MAQITSYSTLQTEVGNWLNRDDLTSDIPTLIQLAEARLKRDERARLLSVISPLTIDAAEYSLPADFYELHSIDWTGTTYYGPIVVVPSDQHGEALGRLGDTGRPVYVSVVEDANGARLLWSPPPDSTSSYTVRCEYWARITALSVAAPTNRWLEDHPDIYLYAALSEAAPFLKDDERIQTWESILQDRLNQLEIAQQRRKYSGTLQRTPGRQF